MTFIFIDTLLNYAVMPYLCYNLSKFLGGPMRFTLMFLLASGCGFGLDPKYSQGDDPNGDNLGQEEPAGEPSDTNQGTPSGNENPFNDECGDGLDNDNDGLADCLDADCNNISDWCIDMDGDGSPRAEDCNDASASTYPGAPEDTSDGIDNDCDGSIDEGGSNGGGNSGTDADQDGYTTAQGDCDDNDYYINPGANDYEGDGVDANCDGVDGNAGSGGTQGQEICNDNIDNDNDGLTDCDDIIDCVLDIYCLLGGGSNGGGNNGGGNNSGEDCTNGIDDNGDGDVDCDDWLCALDVNCLSGGGNNGGNNGGSNSGQACDDTCTYALDGVCDDGGINSSDDSCDFGTDCTDCGSRSVCEDTCTYAFDGVCDDGGPNSSYSVCDRGTDCADCGAYPTSSGGGSNGGGNNGGGNNGGGSGSSSLCNDDCIAWAGDGVCDDGGSGANYNLCLLGSDCSDCGARIDADNDGFDAGWDCDDTDPSTLNSDFDNDYYSDCIDDCDDSDSDINPGATEIAGDGIDQDCDGLDSSSNGGNSGSSGSCCYTLEMSDSWGDGWNGSYMESSANGIAIGTHELAAGSSGSEQICMNSGDNFSLDFVSVGIYDSEISYDLKDAGNSTVASGSSPTGGSIYSETNVCP